MTPNALIALAIVCACHGLDPRGRATHDSSPPTDADGDGWEPPNDCDDENASANPGAAEWCNGLDDDCDGAVDVDAVDAPTWYADDDADGYGAIMFPLTACTAPIGTVDDATDCDDAQAQVHPGHVEVCGDGLDNDCSGDDDYCELQADLLLDADADVNLDTDAIPKPGFIGFMGSPGDVTGDGHDDYAFDFPYADDGTVDSGTLYIRPGPLTQSGSVEAGAVAIAGTQFTNGTIRVAGPVDVDADGYDDLWFGTAGLNAAAALFFGPLGADDTVVTEADVLFVPQQDDALLVYGSLSAAAGDLDGDGNIDLLHGRGDSSGALNACAVWITMGPIDETDQDRIDFRWLGNEPGQLAGMWLGLAIAGDVNGDGLDDAVIGAMEDGSVGPSAGAAFVILGPGSAVSTVDDADWILLPPKWAGAGSATRLGLSVSEAGDLDADGLDDLQIGSAGFETWTDDPNIPIHVLHGRSEPLGTATISDVADATIEGAGGTVDLVGPTGDFDGDGARDLLVTGQYFDGDTGSSFLFLGPLSGAYTTDDARASFQSTPYYGLGFSTVSSDVNEDGLADAIVSPDTGGSTYVVYGGLAP